jgi:hypothetical protein
MNSISPDAVHWNFFGLSLDSMRRLMVHKNGDPIVHSPVKIWLPG